MANKRLLFYNDARHYHLYCLEPPVSMPSLQSMLTTSAHRGPAETSPADLSQSTEPVPGRKG